MHNENCVKIARQFLSADENLFSFPLISCANSWTECHLDRPFDPWDRRAFFSDYLLFVPFTVMYKQSKLLQKRRKLDVLCHSHDKLSIMTTSSELIFYKNAGSVFMEAAHEKLNHINKYLKLRDHKMSFKLTFYRLHKKSLGS